MADVRYGVLKCNIQVETQILSYCPVCAVDHMVMQNFLKLHLVTYSLRGGTVRHKDLYKEEVNTSV